MLFGFGKGHQRPYPKSDNANTDSGSYAPVNVLPITDFRHRCRGNCYHIRFVSDQPNLVGVDVKLQAGSGLDVGDRSTIICDFVTIVSVDTADIAMGIVMQRTVASNRFIFSLSPSLARLRL